MKVEIKLKKIMKLYLIAVMSAILITGTATAQVHLGIKGGVNLYNVPNSNDIKYDMKLGLHMGLLAHIHVAKHFALQPEVVFSTQGATYSASGTDARLKLDYI